jgi:uncharacterized protein (TIGR02118 family)
VIKSVSLLTRKNGMSVEDFQKYWRDVHAPLVAKTPGLRRYIISPTLPEMYEGGATPDFDGIAELWFDDMAAYEASRNTPESKAGLEDSRNFVEKGTRLLATERVMIDAFPEPRDRQGMIRVIAMLKLKEGVPIEKFQDHWLNVHGPINVRNLSGMRRYVQAHVLPEMFKADKPPIYGGLPESWFDSLEAFRNRPPRDPNAERDEAWPTVCSGQNQIIAKEIIIKE